MKKHIIISVICLIIYLSPSLLEKSGTGCLFAQTTNISGTINIYSNITNIQCGNVTVNSSAGFYTGDRVLLIQMKGATIDITNTPSFGTILNYNNAGNYEFATIASITGNTVVLS